MARVLQDAAAVSLMTAEAHLIRIVLELQRGEVFRKVRQVRRMAGGALSGSLTVTGGSRERFDNERCLPEASVLVKSSPREGIIGTAPGGRNEAPSLRRIIHLAASADLPYRALTMALSANTNSLPIPNLPEVNGRFEQRLGSDMAFAHPR